MWVFFFANFAYKSNFDIVSIVSHDKREAN
jgi:hypothetical protein